MNQYQKQKLFNQACTLFFGTFFTQKQPHYEFFQLRGGVNNWSRGIKTPRGKYIVRIYNNGNEIERVKIQHQVLLKLQTMKKSFQTPQPLFIPQTKQTIGVLKSGYLCCAFKIIEGSLPKQFSLQNLQLYGQSVSELSRLMSQIKLSGQPVVKPYYDLYAVHPQGSKQWLINQIKSIQYKQVQQSVCKLLQYIQQTQQKIKQYLSKNLPMQLIHGDVHHDNILVIQTEDQNKIQNIKINGILDFQFIAYDWRAMQFAISISKYIGKENFIEIARHFNKGYKKVNGLSKVQLQALPWLIILRLVSNFIYFVGRASDGRESIDLAKEKVEVYRKRIDNIINKIPEFQKVLLE